MNDIDFLNACNNKLVTGNYKLPNDESMMDRDFEGIIFKDATINEGDFTSGIFINCIFDDVIFNDSDLTGVSFDNCIFDDLTFNRTQSDYCLRNCSVNQFAQTRRND